MPKISVIIPIYNAGKYLEKCLSSVMNQSFTDFEVIMINDGSKDNSAEICQSFAAKDNRFKYFYKENGGASSARNLGIENAAGDYIAFIDSDDFVDNEYFSVLSAPLNNESFTVIQCGMKLIRGDSITELSLENAVFNDIDYIKTILSRKIPIFLFQTPTSKLYNRLFIIENKLRFDEETTISEDCLFNTYLMKSEPQKVCMVKYSGYNYIQDNSMLTKSKATYDRVFHSIRIGNITSGIRYSLIQKHNLENDSEVMKGFHTAVCIIYLSNAREIEANGFSKEEKKKLYESYFSVMNYPVDMAINDYSGTDRKIIEASAAKDAKTIERIYKLREIKSKIKFW